MYLTYTTNINKRSNGINKECKYDFFIE